MTKISQLSSAPTVSQGTVFVVDRGGTTYNVDATAIAAYINGANQGGISGAGSTPAQSQFAVPYIQETLAYGTVAEVEIETAGSGYTSEFDGEIMCLSHGALMYTAPRINDVINEQEDASYFLARGCEVKIRANNQGQVTSARVVQPGQLYRVGDVLKITTLRGCLSQNQPNTEIAKGVNFSPARVRVTRIEPFMIGQSKNNHHHLGSANPWVLSSDYDSETISTNVTSSQSVASSAKKNPANSGLGIINISGGDYMSVEQDWSSTIYLHHSTNETSESIDPYEFNGASSSFPQNNSRAFLGGNHGNLQFHYLLDAALPGSWIIGGSGFKTNRTRSDFYWAEYSANPSSPKSNPSYGGFRGSVSPARHTYETDSAMDPIYSYAFRLDQNDLRQCLKRYERTSNDPDKANPWYMFPTSRTFWNQWNNASEEYGGIAYQEIQNLTSEVDQWRPGFAMHKGFNTMTPVSATLSTIDSKVLDAVLGSDRTGILIAGEYERGIWRPQRTKFPNTQSFGRTVNARDSQTIVCPTRSKYTYHFSRYKATFYTGYYKFSYQGTGSWNTGNSGYWYNAAYTAQGEGTDVISYETHNNRMNGFFLFNIKDILPNLTNAV